MKYDIEKKGDVILLSLKSNLEGGPDTFDLKDEVKSQLGHGNRRFILDMKNAGFVNSTGIGVVVSILSSIKTDGGMLKVAGVTDRVRRAFVTTGVWALFDSHSTVEDALTAFHKS